MNQSTDCWYCGVPFGGKSHPDVYACVKAVNEELYRTALQIDEAKGILRRVVENTPPNRITEDAEAFLHGKSLKPKQEATHCGQCGGILGSPDYGCTCAIKRVCDHKIAPTFDGLGVRYKCQLCNEYVSE